MSVSQPDGASNRLPRRGLIRGGALLAGGAGATVVSGFVRPATAAAADGDPVLAGRRTEASDTTTIANPSGYLPTLELSNPSGPAVRITPTSDSAELHPGDLAARSDGLVTGVAWGNNIDRLVTAGELGLVPRTEAQTPRRWLDTRTEDGRGYLWSSSPDAFDHRGRLRAGSWLDVGVAGVSPGVFLHWVHLNVVAVRPKADGCVTVYTPGPRPDPASLYVSRRVTIANALPVRPGAAENDLLPSVRIWTSATTHLLLDVHAVDVSYSPFGVEAGVEPAATAWDRRRREALARVTSVPQR